ncbi:MAG: hypothetical protein AAFN11_03475 [Chloroflexota bacterium]
MSHDDKTHAERPMPARPLTAWQAWELTVGYIHQNHSADATLRLDIHPLEHIIGWDATLSWGNDKEKVTDSPAFSIALADLWGIVEQNHRLLNTIEAATRRPINYSEDQILDTITYSVFSSLVNSTDTIFTGDWQIIIIYRPIETPSKRVQTRLTADNHKVNRAGNGATLREACRQLLRNAAPVFHQYKIQQENDD